MTDETWEALKQRLRALGPDALPPAQRPGSREQRISFAYGNAKLSNPLVTREMVERAVDELDEPK
jgi:hypothetical protein